MALTVNDAAVFQVGAYWMKYGSSMGFFLQLWHAIAKIKFDVIIYQYDFTDAVALFIHCYLFSKLSSAI